MSAKETILTYNNQILEFYIIATGTNPSMLDFDLGGAEYSKGEYVYIIYHASITVLQTVLHLLNKM